MNRSLCRQHKTSDKQQKSNIRGSRSYSLSPIFDTGDFPQSTIYIKTDIPLMRGPLIYSIRYYLICLLILGWPIQLLSAVTWKTIHFLLTSANKCTVLLLIHQSRRWINVPSVLPPTLHDEQVAFAVLIFHFTNELCWQILILCIRY